MAGKLRGRSLQCVCDSSVDVFALLHATPAPSSPAHLTCCAPTDRFTVAACRHAQLTCSIGRDRCAADAMSWQY